MAVRSPSALATLVDHFARSAAGLPVLGRLSSRLRGAVAAAGDPLVGYRIGRFDVLLPLSHRLPEYQRAFPLYDTALGRLAALVHAEHPTASVVDIGANVGDTAAAIRSASPAPLLCIEGAAQFFPLLEENARHLGPGVFLDRSLVGETASVLAGAIHTRGGTGHVTQEGSERLEMFALQDILARHSSLPAPALVKIDTDGFDCPIVEGSMELWRRLRPVLFFEYDPAFYPGWDPLPMWAALSEAGYGEALVFENTGPYEVRVELRDRTALEDLHARYSGHGHHRYADVAVFAASDSELARRFREGELRATLASRGCAPPPWLERPGH
jgi:FkbM family methyltransferase